MPKTPVPETPAVPVAADPPSVNAAVSFAAKGPSPVIVIVNVAVSPPAV